MAYTTYYLQAIKACPKKNDIHYILPKITQQWQHLAFKADLMASIQLFTPYQKTQRKKQIGLMTQ